MTREELDQRLAEIIAKMLVEDYRRRYDFSDGPEFHEWRFVNGCNSDRTRKMARVHYLRAKKAGCESEFVDVGVLYRDSNGICGICCQPVDFATFTVDHIIPIDKSGPHVRSNLQIAHFACNSRKGNREFPTDK